MRDRLSRNVLRLPSDIKRLAAWEFMEALQELFPERFAELLDIGYYHLGLDFDPDDRAAIAAVDSELAAAVDEWVASLGLNSGPIKAAAWTIAVGQEPESVALISVLLVAGKRAEGTRSIHAYPLSETEEEFLERAKSHYRQGVSGLLASGCVIAGGTKREGEHFKYLVASLVGGYTCEEIAEGRTPFRFQHKSSKTIAGAVRTAARLLGIKLPTNPGPRPGRRRHRRY